ncbi:hypothetical protein B0H67DRAFT_125942 [Lasiosphaeris hirsuta]|uniref:Uncharacterized protein n=1 Tax=Lasiosphaeris hirsuta TaxID=260670 RepID=A0AA40B0A1_9PEZI|nr:hypothetical protein B0H67DRAFT_125942 [Lasiosphaeris hirsuta]
MIASLYIYQAIAPWSTWFYACIPKNAVGSAVLQLARQEDATSGEGDWIPIKACGTGNVLTLSADDRKHILWCSDALTQLFISADPNGTDTGYTGYRPMHLETQGAVRSRPRRLSSGKFEQNHIGRLFRTKKWSVYTATSQVLGSSSEARTHQPFWEVMWRD